MDRSAASRPRGGIHAADVGIEEILGIDGVAPDVGVEVQAAGGEAADLQDGEHGQGGLVVAVGELVGVPAVAGVAAVGVHGAEQAHGGGGLQLVLEVVAGQLGVVGLYVHAEVLVQAVGVQEAGHRFHVEVVLVLGGLRRLGFDVYPRTTGLSG
jgi:hypothetical protein